MQNPQNIRIAVVGCGPMSAKRAESFSRIGCLSALSDIEDTACKGLAKDLNIPFYPFPDLLKRDDIDAVVICTPEDTHAHFAQQSLYAGKHVFVERPLAEGPVEAEPLFLLASEYNCLLFISNFSCLEPAFIALKDSVTAPDFGDVRHVTYRHYLNKDDFANRRRLWGYAQNAFSTLLGMIKDTPTGIRAFFRHAPDGKDSFALHIVMEFSSGMQADIELSSLYQGNLVNMTVASEESAATVTTDSDYISHLSLCRGEGQAMKTTRFDNPQSDVFDEEGRTFLQHIDAKENNAREIDELKTLHLTHYMREAINSGKNVELPRLFSHAASLPDTFIHETAQIDPLVKVGEGTKIWHFSHLLAGTTIGKNCVIAQNVMVGSDVTVGNQCKIQNNVSVYKGVTLEDGVFCGPSCVFTNDFNPRAEIDYREGYRETYVEKGSTIGANATIVCGVRLGHHCLIGAGAVITTDVKPFALMYGVPARQHGWVGHAGRKLDDNLYCTFSDRQYALDENENLIEVEK